MLAKMTAKNQLTLPKAITNAVGPVEYFDVKAEDGQIILTPVRIQRADAVRTKLTAEERDELLADYLPFCTTMRMPSKPPRTPPCRDPFDVPFLQLASAGKADFLVSGDRDLLELGEPLPFTIVTTDEFIVALGTF